MVEKELATRLKLEREKRQMTQVELADAVGVPKDTVSRWERGQLPRFYALRKLSSIFGVEVDHSWFLKEADDASLCQWSVPYHRNAYFVGDDDLLLSIRNRLVMQKERASILAINGIGGIGKTQLALEYAYRYCDDYRAIFWLRADTPEQLDEDLGSLGNLLQVPETHKRKPNQEYIINEVKRWLNKHPGWLLILDNVEEQVEIKPLLLALEGGHILITTRTQATADLAQNILLDKLKPEDAALLVLRRSHLLETSATLSNASVSSRREAIALSRLLGGLPLALDQAAAYIKETRCSLYDYIQLYHKHHKDLLKWKSTHKKLYSNYEASVATTWLISFKRIGQQCPAASDLLRLCSFLYGDAIPETIVLKDMQHSSSAKPGSIVNNTMTFDHACAVLLNYSMLHRNTTDKMLSMHCLVQQVIKDRMSERMYYQWAERAVRAVDQALTTFGKQYIEQYFPQVRTCARLIKESGLKGQEVAHLLEQAATVTRERGWYAQARPLYLKAYNAAADLLGKDDPHVLHLFLEVARAHMDVGVYGMAVIICQRLKEDFEQILGQDHSDVLVCLNTLALAETKMFSFHSAARTCQQALEWHELVIGADPAERAKTYHITAEVYAFFGVDDRALDYYKQARVIRERVFGPESLEMADSLTGLGVFCLARNNLRRAKPLFEQALDIQEKMLGSDHPDTASCIEYLAMISWYEGDYLQAEAGCRQALAIRRQKLGRYHLHIAQSIRGLAALAADQGRDSEAEQYYREALTIYLHAGGPEFKDYLFALSDFADFLRERGRVDEADRYDQEFAAAAIRIGKGEQTLSFVLDQGDEDGQSWPTYMWFRRRPHNEA